MHRTTPGFWYRLGRLPESTQRVANRNFQRLKEDPRHPSDSRRLADTGLSGSGVPIAPSRKKMEMTLSGFGLAATTST